MRITHLVAGGILAVGIAAPFTGCASRSDRARESSLAGIDSFQQRLDGMPNVIDAAVNDMMEATSGQNPNRAADFQAFKRSLANMRDAANHVGAQYEQALGDSSSYFREWNREARNASGADRAAMDAQIASGMATREQALEYFSQARTHFLSLVESMTAIETRLTASLSEQAVLDAQPQIQSALVEATNTRNYIDRLDETLDSVRAEP